MTQPSGVFDPFYEDGGSDGGRSSEAVIAKIDIANRSSEALIASIERANGDPFGKFDANGIASENADASFDTSFDTSFDSSSFRFPATSGVSSGLESNDSRLDDVDDSFQSDFGPPGETDGRTAANELLPSAVSSSLLRGVPVSVSIHEEMTCLYDSFSKTSSSSVEGSIHVTSAAALEGNPFCLTLRDPEHHLDELSDDPGFVDIITRDVEHAVKLGSFDRVLRVTIPVEDAVNVIPIATYGCTQTLRPVPLLVQTKVKVVGKFSRVGVKVRSNPSNESTLRNVAILLAVPPDVNGDTVKMNRRGGVWDPMKRIVVWTSNELQPGGLLEVQAQFEFVSAGDTENARMPPKFPVLVRASATENQFSRIEIDAKFVDDFSMKVNLNLSRSFRLLHRKV